MYIAMRRYTGAKWSDVEAKRVQAEFLPIVRKIKGFKDYYCVDGGNGVLTTISVFEDKAGAEESGRQAATWVKDNMKDFAPNPPEVTAGSVIAH